MALLSNCKPSNYDVEYTCGFSYSIPACGGVVLRIGYDRISSSPFLPCCGYTVFRLRNRKCVLLAWRSTVSSVGTVVNGVRDVAGCLCAVVILFVVLTVVVWIVRSHARDINLSGSGCACASAAGIAFPVTATWQALCRAVWF